MYLPIFTLLNEQYLRARRLLSEGDLSSARTIIDKARSLRSRVKRQVVYSKELSNDSWRQKLGFDDSTALEYSRIVKQVNTEWQQIGEWFASIIDSIGVDELLRTEDGVDLLLDVFIPEVWDFNVDVIIIAAKHEQFYLTPLLRRGQSVIIVVDEDCDDTGEQSGAVIQREDETTILYVPGNEPLHADQVSALDRGQSPTIAYISHDDSSVSADTLSKLNSSIMKGFISTRSLTRWPAIFTEQLIVNLPRTIGLRSGSDLMSVFRGHNIMVVSPGPSLLHSLPKIQRWREHFVLVALVRSLDALLDHGIVPDYAIMVDAQDHTDEKHKVIIPNDPLIAEIPLLVTDFTHPTTFDLNFKEVILLPGPAFIGSAITTALHGTNPIWVTGSSVACAAVMLLADLRASSITLVGQDLSASGTSYASGEAPILANATEHDHLTCQGIDGTLLPTRSDYLFFKSELEEIARLYGDNVRMFNCTEFGAYLENWNHISLTDTHPAIAIGTDKTSILDGDPQGGPDQGSTEIYAPAVLEAIRAEIQQLDVVKNSAQLVLVELHRLLDEQANDVTLLEILEENMLEAMSTEGSLIAFHCQPATLAAAASLKSVSSLRENFMISIDYYSTILAGTESLIGKFRDSEYELG